MISTVIESVTQSGITYRITYADGTVSFLCADPKNTDYVKLQAWVAAGGTVTVTLI
jgi:hypothetical protein